MLNYQYWLKKDFWDVSDASFLLAGLCPDSSLYPENWRVLDDETRAVITENSNALGYFLYSCDFPKNTRIFHKKISTRRVFTKNNYWLGNRYRN